MKPFATLSIILAACLAVSPAAWAEVPSPGEPIYGNPPVARGPSLAQVLVGDTSETVVTNIARGGRGLNDARGAWQTQWNVPAGEPGSLLSSIKNVGQALTIGDLGVRMTNAVVQGTAVAQGTGSTLRGVGTTLYVGTKEGLAWAGGRYISNTAAVVVVTGLTATGAPALVVVGGGAAAAALASWAGQKVIRIAYDFTAGTVKYIYETATGTGDGVVSTNVMLNPSGEPGGNWGPGFLIDPTLMPTPLGGDGPGTPPRPGLPQTGSNYGGGSGGSSGGTGGGTAGVATPPCSGNCP